MFRPTSQNSLSHSSGDRSLPDPDHAASALRDRIAKAWSNLIWAETFPHSDRAVSFLWQLNAQTQQLAEEALLLSPSTARDQVLKGAISLHWRNGTCRNTRLTNKLAAEVARIWGPTHPKSQATHSCRDWLSDVEPVERQNDSLPSSFTQMQDEALKTAIAVHWQHGARENNVRTGQLAAQVARVFGEELNLRVGDQSLFS